MRREVCSVAKKTKKEKKEKTGKKGKKGKLPKRKREPQTPYDAAVSTLGKAVCIYAVLTVLGILLAVALGVLAAG